MASFSRFLDNLSIMWDGICDDVDVIIGLPLLLVFIPPLTVLAACGMFLYIVISLIFSIED